MPKIKFEHITTCIVECEVTQELINQGREAVAEDLIDNIGRPSDTGAFDMLEQVTIVVEDDEVTITTDLSELQTPGTGDADDPHDTHDE